MLSHDFVHIDAECLKVISELKECNTWSVSPSEVCLRCYQENHKAIWLTHLTCIKSSEHLDCGRITVVINNSPDDQQLVPVRSAGHLSKLNVSKIQLCRHNSGYCPKGEDCWFAHSEEELNYWQWERAKEMLQKEFSLVSHEVKAVISAEI